MSINWFETVSIIINFFILLFILQKLFYKPVIKVMAERQARIDESLSMAKEKEEEANALIASYEDKLKHVEKTKEDIFSKAKEEAKDKKKQWLETYQEEAKVKRQHYFDELLEEKQTFSASLQDQMVTGAIDVASKLLDDTKNQDWEQSLFQALTKKLKNYDFPDPIKEMVTDDHKLVFVSATSINEEQKKTLERALSESSVQSDSLSYKEDPSLILGYELQMPSYTIYASIRNYLSNSEEKLSALLDRTPFDEEK